MTRRDELASGLRQVEARIAAACVAAGRQRREVTLVAVSKTWPAGDVAILRQLGLADFGENKAAEAAAKAAVLPDLRWHFVGQVQTNKARLVTSYASVVHSLDRPRLAAALSAGAMSAGRVVDVLLQVRLDEVPGRGGAAIADLPGLAELVAGLAGLRLTGVMAVAPLGADPREAFDTLRQESERLQRDHPQASTISAGMTADLEPAVACGATLVRVGTALFGHRPAVLG